MNPKIKVVKHQILQKYGETPTPPKYWNQIMPLFSYAWMHSFCYLPPHYNGYSLGINHSTLDSMPAIWKFWQGYFNGS